MGQKRCISCEQIKQISDFYKHPAMADGHLGKCKECCKRDIKKNRSEKSEYYKAYDKERANLPHRVEARFLYSKTSNGILSGNKAKKKWQEKNADRRAAHGILGRAIKSGKIIRMPCEVCGSTEKIHGHHEDYTKPLEVKWLCPQHHKDAHKNVTGC